MIMRVVLIDVNVIIVRVWIEERIICFLAHTENRWENNSEAYREKFFQGRSDSFERSKLRGLLRIRSSEELLVIIN